MRSIVVNIRRGWSKTLSCLIAAFSVSLVVFPALAWDMLVWGNRYSDMNAASSWNDADGNVSEIAPSANTVLFFTTKAVVQPVLTSSLTVIGLHFHACTNNTSAAVPQVHPDDGEGGYNYSGYRITGTDGAVLTLDGNNYNNGWTRDVQMATKGTNTIAVAVVFTDNRAHYVYSSGGRLIFEKPVSTHATSAFTAGGQAYGRVVFAAPNPDFAPTRVDIQGEVAMADPRAFEAVPKFYSGCWGWGTSVNGFASEKACRFVNATDEPAVITATAIELGDHDAFYFDGGPFPMSNTVFKSNLRGSNIGGSANVTVKEFVCSSSVAGRYFDKRGSGLFVNLGDYCRTSTVTNELRVSQGTYIAMTTNGLSLSRNVLWGDTTTFNSIGARIGVNFDYAPEHSSDNDGDLRFNHWNRPEGFAAVGGVRHVNLYNGALLRRGLTHPVLTSGNWRQFANTMGFGAEGTDGTVVLDNDIDLNISSGSSSQNETSVYVWDGDAFVDARFAGMVTNAPASNPTHLWVRLSKREKGVLALDGPCYVTSDGRVYEGGLLVNNTIACKYIVYDGAWIGGTGYAHALETQSGGALRPGEQGGTLTSDGAVTMADGSKFIVDVDDNVHGCLKLTGSSVAYKANGTITVVPSLVDELTSGRTVKILDWQNVSNPTDSTLFNIANWTVDADTNVFSRATLSIDDTALYLFVRPKFKPGFVLVVR